MDNNNKKISVADFLRFFQRIPPIEIIITLLLVACINYFYYPLRPGFQFEIFNPFYFTILFFSVFYGKISGFLSFLFSLFLIFLLTLISIYQHWIYSTFFDFLNAFLNQYRFSEGDKIITFYRNFSFACLISIFVFGEVRDFLGRNIRSLKNDLVKQQKNYDNLIYELEALTLINNEYQSRIIGQESSLISLYQTMVELNTVDSTEIYPGILDAIVRFTSATRCSLWKYNIEEKNLELISSKGWENDLMDKPKMVSDRQTILGWVARNSEMFSINMLQKHSNLRKLDKKINIITVPIIIQEKVWGLINIEELPFIKYNNYSENLCQMISNMSAPIIQNAMYYKEITSKGEMDKVTGLFSHGSLFVVLNQKFEDAQRDQRHLSLVIMEMTNFDDLCEFHQKDKVKGLFKEISHLCRLASKTALVFEYSQDNQLAIILSNMDYDGTMIYCQNLKSKIERYIFHLNDEIVHPIFIFGFSSQMANHKTAAELIDLADELLEIQKTIQVDGIESYGV